MSDAGEMVALATRQRAAVYAHLFLVLRRELGGERAVELMSKAIWNYGAEKSKRNYSEEAQKGDLERAAREFASPDPVKQHQFAPRIVSLEPGEAVLAMSGCPLVDEWRQMGLPDRDVETLCEIAHSVDFGTWEGALPFRLRFESTRGQGRDECVLRVKKARADD
ncbi:MAG: L-2-amino-thiazoline-4-carboxylic acid hydrolase [Deltaproteobacteria bacterium]|nr:L-2-amino-thiazoline-4-carboxylic acid hydrolase [Deltaproteobacteria bacterium]